MKIRQQISHVLLANHGQLMTGKGFLVSFEFAICPHFAQNRVVVIVMYTNANDYK